MQSAKLSDVTTARVTAFVTKLRSEAGLKRRLPATCEVMRAAMRWANREGLLTVLPKFTMPKRVKGAKAMRGRAITLEEFERMIEATPKVVENAAAESWKFYLRGLVGKRVAAVGIVDAAVGRCTRRNRGGPDADVGRCSASRPKPRRATGSIAADDAGVRHAA